MEHEQHHQSATFEKINATLDRISEMQEKAALEMEEMRKNSSLEMKKTREEEKRRQKEIDKKMKELQGLFDSQWGKLMESLVEGDLVPLLQKRDISVTYTHTHMHGRHNGEHFEFDILVENGEEVVVVEVKTTLRPEDVAHFLEKLGKFTTYRPLYKARKIYGAVAYLKADSSVTLYAERQGLFVIRATGSSASITNAEDFKPRKFS